MKQHDVDRLRETIMTEAKRDRQRILSTAQGQVDEIREQAESDATSERDRIVETAEVKAARIKREAVGSAGLEARAFKTRRRESLIQCVFDEALERLANPSELEDYKSVVEGLVAEASEHLGGLDVVKVSGDKATLDLMDREFLDNLGEVIGYHIEVGEPLLEGTGIILESPDGRLRYDNTFQTRLSRMRSALRASVYRILMGEAQGA